MLERFTRLIREQGPFDPHTPLLAACSGGVDSTVLAHLLKQAGFAFAIAHCNFQLRGGASDQDEHFCGELAKQLGVEFHSKRFNVKEKTGGDSESVQMRARRLRYQWFEDLMRQHGYRYILTAHHANDAAETFMLNLARGTGIGGLTGIRRVRDSIVRPLLQFTKKEILNFATQHNIRFREDASNESVAYRRNFVRHKIIPQFEQIQPAFIEVMTHTMAHLAEEAAIVGDVLRRAAAEISRETNGELHISRHGLEKCVFKNSLLQHLIGRFGFSFSQQQSILNALKGESGKLFFSRTHSMVIDRDDLIVQAVSLENDHRDHTFHSLEALVDSGIVSFSKLSSPVRASGGELLVEEERLVFPVRIRSWKAGDRMRPFGMRGTRLVSDCLKDRKVDRLRKKSVPVLENGNGDIVWLLGFAASEDYRVANGKACIRMSYHGKG